jgi:hypothetical protein
MVECVICLDEIENEYAIIHNVNEINKLHPECIQKWTEHSLIGIMTRDIITTYSIFKDDRYIKTVTVPQNQKRVLIEDERLTFREILSELLGHDESQDDDSSDSLEFSDRSEMTFLSAMFIFIKLCFCLDLE